MASLQEPVSDIFTVDGKPLMFYLRPCKQGANISRLVTNNGGRMTWEPDKNGRYTLFIPGDIISMKDAVSVQFVEDSIESAKLKNVEQYRYIYLKNKEKAASKVTEYVNHLGDSDFIPKTIVKRRGEYSFEEDLKIINHVLKHSKNHSVNGQRLWEILTQNKIIKRTAQSLKERFLKRILPYLENYSLSDIEKRKLSSLTSMKTRRVVNSAKPTKHRLACLGGDDPYALSTDSEESQNTSAWFKRVTRNQSSSQAIDNQSDSQSSCSSKKSPIAIPNKDSSDDRGVTTRLMNLLELPDAISSNSTARLSNSPKVSTAVAVCLERLNGPEAQLPAKRRISDNAPSHTCSTQSAAQLSETLDILPTAGEISNVEPTGIKRLRKSTDVEVQMHSDEDLFTQSAISSQDNIDSPETQQKNEETLSTLELPSIPDSQPSTQNVSSHTEFSSLEIIDEVSPPKCATYQEEHSETKWNNSNNVMLILAESDQSSDAFDMQNGTSSYTSPTKYAGALTESQKSAAVPNAQDVSEDAGRLSVNQPIALSPSSELFTGLTPESQIFDDLASGECDVRAVTSSDHGSEVNAEDSLKPLPLVTAKSMLQRTGKLKFENTVNNLSKSMDECTVIQSSILTALTSQSMQSNAEATPMLTPGHEKYLHILTTNDDPKSQAGSSWSSLDSALVNSSQGTCVTPPPELTASVPPTVERVSKLSVALSQPMRGEQKNQRLNQENDQRKRIASNKSNFDSPLIMEVNSELPKTNGKTGNQLSIGDASNLTTDSASLCSQSDSLQPDRFFKTTSPIETQYHDCFSQVQTASQQSTNSTADGNSSWNTCSNSSPKTSQDVDPDPTALTAEPPAPLDSHCSPQKVKLDKPAITFCDHAEMPGTSTQVLDETNILCHINKIKQHPEFAQLLMEHGLSEHILFALVGGFSGNWVQVTKYLETRGAEGRLWQRCDDDVLLNNTLESEQYRNLRKHFTTEQMKQRKTFLEGCVDLNG